MFSYTGLNKEQVPTPSLAPKGRRPQGGHAASTVVFAMRLLCDMKRHAQIVAARRGLGCGLVCRRHNLCFAVGFFVQVAHLRSKYQIYMLDSGRISMCGITEANAAYLADAIDDAVRNIHADASGDPEGKVE